MATTHTRLSPERSQPVRYWITRLRAVTDGYEGADQPAEAGDQAAARPSFVPPVTSDRCFLDGSERHLRLVNLQCGDVDQAVTRKDASRWGGLRRRWHQLIV